MKFAKSITNLGWQQPKRIFSSFLLVVFIGAIAFLMLFPILWALSTSLKDIREILAIPPHLIPHEPTMANYQRLVRGDVGIVHNIRNSLFYSISAVFLTLVFGSLAAYAFARLQFAAKDLLLIVVVSCMTIPLMATLTPTYFYLTWLKLVDRWYTLILIYWAHNLPLAIWLLRGFFQSIPTDMEKAALVDGYSRVESFYKVLLPLSRPGLITVALFVFLGAWNDYIVSLTMIKNPALRTLSVAIESYLGEFGREWGPLTAAAIVAIVPVVVLFVLFRNYFLGGLTSGAVKG